MASVSPGRVPPRSRNKYDFTFYQKEYLSQHKLIGRTRLPSRRRRCELVLQIVSKPQHGNYPIIDYVTTQLFSKTEG